MYMLKQDSLVASQKLVEIERRRDPVRQPNPCVTCYAASKYLSRTDKSNFSETTSLAA